MVCFYVCVKGTKRGTEFPCPAGTYNNRTGLERKEDCVPCTTGHYCPQGTTNPRECPRGTFNDVLSAKVHNTLLTKTCTAVNVLYNALREEETGVLNEHNVVKTKREKGFEFRLTKSKSS